MDDRKLVFNKKYDGNSICDLYRDVSEAIDADFNPVIKEIPQFPGGIQKGTFTVTIEWESECPK